MLRAVKKIKVGNLQGRLRFEEQRLMVREVFSRETTFELRSE